MSTITEIDDIIVEKMNDLKRQIESSKSQTRDLQRQLEQCTFEKNKMLAARDKLLTKFQHVYDDLTPLIEMLAKYTPAVPDGKVISMLIIKTPQFFPQCYIDKLLTIPGQKGQNSDILLFNEGSNRFSKDDLKLLTRYGLAYFRNRIQYGCNGWGRGR